MKQPRKLFGMKKPRAIPDIHAARELNIFINNDYPTYQRKSWLMQNYSRKIAKGKYNKTLAAKGVYNNVVIPAARKYEKEYGGKFDRVTRQAAATAATREMWRDLKDNDFKWKA